ncbi:hypothetical protein [Serratia sp. DD3]|uniref:hypothetical protein n=1 Tax=Serratia sp. DD3 TaxID=1410619 RepID=UPI0003C51BE8|nr:hypothetical protein [Serratia sp. DD3]KEY59851.1 hypothetical protein SRDD_11900 [Serratia sp. DD3]
MEKIICGLCNTAVELTVLSSHLLANHGWKMAAHLAKPLVEASLVDPQSCKCPVCNVSLKDAKRLEKHVSKVHPEGRSTFSISSSPSKKNCITAISYQWAITQQLDKKYSAVIEKFVAEKTLSEIEKEIVTIVNGYDAADDSRQSLMSGRLILLAHAKKRIAAKSKSSKNKKVTAKGKKTKSVKSRDIMDQYIGGRRIVVSGGLPSLGKR